ncbi:TPA: hypothetical protein SIA39_003670 [Aeromonas sobria]|nr:hypothetical protein [Aeromonas sobria]
MKQWIIFIFVPFLFICLLELIGAVVMGGIFQLEEGGFWSLVSTFVFHFIGGSIILYCAPRKSPTLAYAMALIICCIGFYLGISTDGNVTTILGERVVQDFSWLQEFVRSAGVFLAVIGAVQSEADERNQAAA